MSATALYWLQLQQTIRLRIAELAGVFREGITANASVADPASGSEPPELSTVFRLAQEEAAENWLSAMGAACIVQLMAEAQSVWEHPNWRFLYALSKEEIAPRLEELLHASFGITKKDLGLIKRWGDHRGGGASFHLKRRTASIAPAFYIAQAKKRAVNQILDLLLGVSRKLAFGVPLKPKFGVPAAQIHTMPAPDAQPGPSVPPPMDKPTPESLGRYRVDKVLQAEKEIGVLRSLINSLADYDRIKIQHPEYITIRACEKDPALKELLLGIQGHTQKKALRFAKQIAAQECSKKLSTIETAWDRYKPEERRNPKKRRRKDGPPARRRARRKSRGKK